MQALEATYTGRVRSCEEDRAGAARAHDAQEQQRTWDWQHREAQLTSERDEQHKVAEVRTRELDRCRADLATQSRAPANVDRVSPDDPIGIPPTVGETPMPGSSPKRVAPPAPEPSPFGPAPAEGTLDAPLRSSEGRTVTPGAAAANW
jgi:hypothetical protein